MKVNVIFVTLVIFLSSCQFAVSQVRILNGKNASIQEHPFYTRIHISYYTEEGLRAIELCGGSIIDSEWVLTADHCLDGFIEAALYFSIDHADQMTNSTMRKSKKIFHAVENGHLIDGCNHIHDIGLIKLDVPLTFTDKIGPIHLPRRHEKQIYVGTMVEVIGFGITESVREEPSKELRMVELELYDAEHCEKERIPDNCTKIPEAEKEAAFVWAGVQNEVKAFDSGDSGGPFWAKRMDNTPVILGVASWTLNTKLSDPRFSFFVRVSAHLDWINSTIQNN